MLDILEMIQDEIKSAITDAEAMLPREGFVIACSFERNGRVLRVGITERFRKACKKGRVWKSKPFLATFKNAEYGFDETHARSPVSGGA